MSLDTNETNHGFHAIIPGRNLSRQSAIQRKKTNPMKNIEKTYRSEACEAIYELASGLYEAGVMDERTFREFEDSCLFPKKRDTRPGPATPTNNRQAPSKRPS